MIPLWAAIFITFTNMKVCYPRKRVLARFRAQIRRSLSWTYPTRTSQLAFNTMATSALAAVGVMVATVRTGIHLLRS